MDVSNAQIDRLGESLRTAAEVTAPELQLLQEFRIAHEPAMFAVQARLASSLGVQATSRLKTVNTIVDKLRRERVRLSQMQDIAGVRVVVDGGLRVQEGLVEGLKTAFDGPKVFDRRVRPSHGYRAVHVVVKLDSRFVEIQVRTQLQDAWAQSMERLADRLGRGVRYGAGMEHPVVARLQALSGFIYAVESGHVHRIAGSSHAGSTEAPLQFKRGPLLDSEVETDRAEIRAMLEQAIAELSESD